MRTLTNLALVLCAFLLCSGKKSPAEAYDPAHLYSIEELREDFQLYRTKVEKRHPNLYLYTPKEKLDHYFDSIYNGINRPMTELEFYRHITPVVSVIKDGHNFITPGEAQGKYKDKHAKYLPLHMQWLKEKLYVDMDCTSGTAIPDGAEIISINGVPASEVVNQMLIRLPRDGENQTLPVYLLNTFFIGFYADIYGTRDQYTIEFVDEGRDVKNSTLEGLLYDSLAANRKRKYPAWYAKEKEIKGVTLELDEQLSTATLTIPSFDKTVIKKQYHQDFKKVIDKMMNEIAAAKIENLVIDVRGNGGGNPTFARYLLCYIMNQPFRYAQECYSVRKCNAHLKRSRNRRRYCPGMGLGKFKPFKHAFTGAVYVLTDGGSFSATGEFSSCLSRYHRAVFIGEEVSGNKTIEGGQFFNTKYEMPNTKIIFFPATEATVLRDLSLNDGHGVYPDHFLQPSITDIISGKDVAKEFAYELIRNTAVKTK